VPLHRERALARALVQHLGEELHEVDFALIDHPSIDVLWMCGYERGNAALIGRWRARHPHATLLVTAKEPVEAFAGEVLAAGADHALSWPVDLARLERILTRRRPLQRLA
jgi:broad specificity phosphatase PhoE